MAKPVPCGLVSGIRRRYRCLFLLSARSLWRARRPGGRVGIQFQQPVLAFMVAVITLFALNMWGLFEIHLPGAVSEAAVNASGQGAAVFAGIYVRYLPPCWRPRVPRCSSAPRSICPVAGAIEIYAVFLADWARAPWTPAAFPLLVSCRSPPGC